MKEYKFRGRDIYTGEYVYAELGQISAEINPGYFTFITDDVHIVTKDSIAQLVGRDRNGTEIYEKDTLRNPIDGTTFKAAMNHIYTVRSYVLQEQAL